MALDLEKRSSIKNLCPWAISFVLPNSKAEVLLDAHAKTTVNNQELVTLCENSNVMFAGTGLGNHARVFIENPDVRIYVGFDTEDKKQKILDDELCKKIFEYKTLSAFKKHIEENVVAEHEKHKIMSYARSIKLNDFDRIDFLQEYTGLNFKE